MTDGFEPEPLIDAVAPALGLTVAEDCRTAVAQNLRVAARMAALVMSEPLGDHAEPAAVFLPARLDGEADA